MEVIFDSATQETSIESVKKEEAEISAPVVPYEDQKTFRKIKVGQITEAVRDEGTKIGDGDNYTKHAKDGELTLHGTARVKRHFLIDPTRFKLPASNYPAQRQEGVFPTLDFDKTTDESAYCEEHIPYRWDTSTDVEVEVHWFHDNSDNGKVMWGVEYRAIADNEVVNSTTTTITQLSAGNHTEGEVQSTIFASKILHGNLTTHDSLGLRFFREASTATDTLNEDARIVNICFHFTQNKLGEAT